MPGSTFEAHAKPDFSRAAAWRTSTVDRYSDASHAADVTRAGVTLLRGSAQIAGAGAVVIDGERYAAKTIVIATGSTDQIPNVDGIERVPYWTSRDATAAGEAPKSLVVLGGGAVGVELGQMFARFGTSVILLDSGPRILSQESEGLSDLIAAALERDGVAIVATAQAQKLTSNESSVEVRLADGRAYGGARLLVVNGREPRSSGIGLESIGITLDERKCIPVDDTCTVVPGVYAIGDVTGKAMFTHVAKYQGRIAAAAILGKRVLASYETVPRCVLAAPRPPPAKRWNKRMRSGSTQLAHGSTLTKLRGRRCTSKAAPRPPSRS